MAIIRRNLGLAPAIEIPGRLGVVHRSGALTFPKARSTESKYRNTPKRMKKMPKPVVPTPISATGKKAVMGWALGRGWDRCPLGVVSEIPFPSASVLPGSDGTGKEGWA